VRLGKWSRSATRRGHGIIAEWGNKWSRTIDCNLDLMRTFFRIVWGVRSRKRTHHEFRERDKTASKIKGG